MPFLAATREGITYSSNDFDRTSQQIPRFNHGGCPRLALVTLLTSRRGRTAYALATTLTAGSLTFAGCSPERAGGQGTPEEPTRVASAMGTGSAQASTSAAESLTLHHTSSRQTTLSARAFLDYLDEGQHEQVLGQGLDLRKLTRAQQVTVLKVLESLLNDDAYRTVSALLNHITTTPGVEAHYLRFSAVPAMDQQWKLDLDGPMLGINALLAEKESVIFESAHFALTSDDIQTILDQTDSPAGQSAIALAQVPAEELLTSLTPQQRSTLAGTSVAEGGGLRGTELSDAQRQMLIDLTTNWIHLGDESAVMSKQTKIVDTLDDTYFSLTHTPDDTEHAAKTFQVKGPEIFIEFTETPGADGQVTIQSVFEDPTLAS